MGGYFFLALCAPIEDFGSKNGSGTCIKKKVGVLRRSYFLNLSVPAFNFRLLNFDF